MFICVSLQCPQVSQHKAKGGIFFKITVGSAVLANLSSRLGKGTAGEGNCKRREFGRAAFCSRAPQTQEDVQEDSREVCRLCHSSWNRWLQGAGTGLEWWRMEERNKGKADRRCLVIPARLLGQNQRKDVVSHPAVPHPVYVTLGIGSVERWALNPAFLSARVLKYEISVPPSSKILWNSYLGLILSQVSVHPEVQGIIPGLRISLGHATEFNPCWNLRAPASHGGPEDTWWL